MKSVTVIASVARQSQPLAKASTTLNIQHYQKLSRATLESNNEK